MQNLLKIGPESSGDYENQGDYESSGIESNKSSDRFSRGDFSIKSVSEKPKNVFKQESDEESSHLQESKLDMRKKIDSEKVFIDLDESKPEDNTESKNFSEASEIQESKRNPKSRFVEESNRNTSPMNFDELWVQLMEKSQSIHDVEFTHDLQELNSERSQANMFDENNSQNIRDKKLNEDLYQRTKRMMERCEDLHVRPDKSRQSHSSSEQKNGQEKIEAESSEGEVKAIKKKRRKRGRHKDKIKTEESEEISKESKAKNKKSKKKTRLKNRIVEDGEIKDSDNLRTKKIEGKDDKKAKEENLFQSSMDDAPQIDFDDNDNDNDQFDFQGDGVAELDPASPEKKENIVKSPEFSSKKNVKAIEVMKKETPKVEMFGQNFVSRFKHMTHDISAFRSNSDISDNNIHKQKENKIRGTKLLPRKDRKLTPLNGRKKPRARKSKTKGAIIFDINYTS